jgi:excinuclease UvrABC ATPase subunit
MDLNIMSMIITHGVPLVKSYVIQQINDENSKKSLELDNIKTEKQYKLYNKYQHLDKIDSSPEMTKEEIGRQMWEESHGSIDELDENADEKQVKKTMKSIEKSFKKHPCKECSDNAKKNLKEIPLNKSTTKEEAKQTLCEFHNKVNGDLGKPSFNCNTWSF